MTAAKFVIVCSAFLATILLTRIAQTSVEPPQEWTTIHQEPELRIDRTRTEPSSYRVISGTDRFLIDATVFDPTATQVFLTHHHVDATGCAQKYLDAGIPVHAPKLSESGLEPTRVTKFWKDSVPLRSSNTAY
ncbi:MAG: MBL fold metallo-hydrolase, partial [Gemmataceae bacterium]